MARKYVDVIGVIGNSTPIVGCVTRHTPASDANSIFITSSFAASVAIIVASATAIEMVFV